MAPFLLMHPAHALSAGLLLKAPHVPGFAQLQEPEVSSAQHVRTPEEGACEGKEMTHLMLNPAGPL